MPKPSLLIPSPLSLSLSLSRACLARRKLFQTRKMTNRMTKRRWVFVVLFIIPVFFSLRSPKIEKEETNFSVFLQRSDWNRAVSFVDHSLEYDFYREKCPQAEAVVRSAMAVIYSQHKEVTAALLRLFFHDCFIKGCDASILLDDSRDNRNYTTEKQAIPNRTLRGFDIIDRVKGKLEIACPGIVSCADTLALATRDGIVLAGGPFYPVFTGRRDSTQSYFLEALAEIPKPSDNINQTLHLFGLRGFEEKETVSLLGAHNVGKISCDFIKFRLNNFSGTGQPDLSMAPDFLTEMRLNCQEDSNRIIHDAAPASTISREMRNSTLGRMVFQGLSASISSGENFDAHYYQNLLRGRGLLFADQQLMANENTARFVRDYASDEGTAFRRDFSRAMVKMSNLGVLTGTQGQVRINCSSLIRH